MLTTRRSCSQRRWVEPHRSFLLACLLVVLAIPGIVNARPPGLDKPVPLCNDGLPCTFGDVRQAGICAGTPVGNVQVIVQLSPGMMPESFERCISFSFFSTVSPQLAHT